MREDIPLFFGSSKKKNEGKKRSLLLSFSARRRSGIPLRKGGKAFFSRLA